MTLNIFYAWILDNLKKKKNIVSKRKKRLKFTFWPSQVFKKSLCNQF